MRKYHTMSVEDREMFEYNRRHEEIQRHLSQPENRIKYCYEFMKDGDFHMRNTAFESALKYIATCDWEEAHY